MRVNKRCTKTITFWHPTIAFLEKRMNFWKVTVPRLPCDNRHEPSKQWKSTKNNYNQCPQTEKPVLKVNPINVTKANKKRTPSKTRLQLIHINKYNQNFEILVTKNHSLDFLNLSWIFLSFHLKFTSLLSHTFEISQKNRTLLHK